MPDEDGPQGAEDSAMRMPLDLKEYEEEDSTMLTDPALPAAARCEEVSAKRLCRRWARGEECSALSCPFRHVLLDEREEARAARAKAQRAAALIAQRESDDIPEGAKGGHTSRHAEFVAFLRSTFGDATLRDRGTVDIAGGRGAVSFELHCRLGIPCTLVEPRELNLRSHQRKYLRKTGAPMFAHLPVALDDAFSRSAEGSKLLQGRVLLGLHPDEATEAIVDAAVEHGTPFAVVPCCVFPSAFPTRRLGDGRVVRSYEHFCQYLVEKAPPGTIQVACLPFEGKNRVLYRTAAHLGQTIGAIECAPADDDDAAEEPLAPQDGMAPLASQAPRSCGDDTETGAIECAPADDDGALEEPLAPQDDEAPPASEAPRSCGDRAETQLPPEVRVQTVHEYDVAEYPFTELVCEALGVTPSELCTLHETDAGRHAQREPPRSGHDPFRRRWTTFISSESAARRRLDALLRRFVAVRVRAALGNRWEHFVYQALPSFRVHLAHTRALGVPHCDADYYHQPNELNFWMPLVERVSGSNSLYCESAPGEADYQPFEVRRGQVVQFYGNKARHYTLPNTTDVTRVSIDLRVIPLPFFARSWTSPKGTVPFRLGQYYTSTLRSLNYAAEAELRLAAASGVTPANGACSGVTAGRVTSGVRAAETIMGIAEAAGVARGAAESAGWSGSKMAEPEEQQGSGE